MLIHISLFNTIKIAVSFDFLEYMFIVKYFQNCTEKYKGKIKVTQNPSTM